MIPNVQLEIINSIILYFVASSGFTACIYPKKYLVEKMMIININGCHEPGIIILLLLICIGGLSKNCQLTIIEIISTIKNNIKSFTLEYPFIENNKKTTGAINDLGGDITLCLVALTPIKIK
ncbi:MAG: hypothetical protein LN563_02990 [Rickettsia endosymbiont of Platyusa sonomae]|nr:hypothetical protein [Rickettsia endosymbiont of Platyusa sonomae]